MNVVLLHRQPFGGIATYARVLRDELIRQGFEVQILEASEQIPNATGMKVDKMITAWLKEAVGDADLVHAVGYRAAWACAEAFGYDEAWVYTAYDMPKTTNNQLIDRLNRSQAGIAASNAVWRELDQAFALDLSVIYPGVPTEREEHLSPQQARAKMGLPDDAVVIGAMGRWEPGQGFRDLIDSMYPVFSEHPTAQLVLCGQGGDEAELRHRAEGLPQPERVHFLGHVEDPSDVLAGLDLFVQPNPNAGASMGVLEAMADGVPVLVRSESALGELIVDGVSGYGYSSDEQLGTRIAELLSMTLTLETVGRAGRLRILERFTIEESARSVAELYETVTQDLL